MLSSDITSVLKSKVTEWIASQPIFIQALFRKYLLGKLSKLNLTIEEAAAYSNIGINKFRELMKQPGCSFVIYIYT